MTKTIQVQQRFPEELLLSIDAWAGDAMSRTAAVNHMCREFLEGLEMEKLRKENEGLREKVVALAMGKATKEDSDNIRDNFPKTWEWMKNKEVEGE